MFGFSCPRDPPLSEFFLLGPQSSRSGKIRKGKVNQKEAPFTPQRNTEQPEVNQRKKFTGA
jgi:hypothetical protein